MNGLSIPVQTVPLFYMQQPFTLDCGWAGLCLVGAVYFIFRC